MSAISITLIVDEEGSVSVYVDGSEELSGVNNELATRRVTVEIPLPCGQEIQLDEQSEKPAVVK